jgi:cysteinyl-tRNA synthetase
LIQTTLNYLQNRNLFSNHYLESLIKDDPVWNDDVTDAFNQAKKIYNTRKGSWKNINESMLEDLNTPAVVDKLLDFVAQRLEAQPEESDVIHNLLAYLAERMIEMNKEKNADIKSFLTFIEGETGADIDDMTNKTAIREYYNHEFQKLIDILVKNKKKLKDGYDPKSPTNYRHFNEWYKDSVSKLQPLMGRIEATDELIDQIVYRLYGLTEDEIKIVEESISGGKNE